MRWYQEAEPRRTGRSQGLHLFEWISVIIARVANYCTSRFLIKRTSSSNFLSCECSCPFAMLRGGTKALIRCYSHVLGLPSLQGCEPDTFLASLWYFVIATENRLRHLLKHLLPAPVLEPKPANPCLRVIGLMQGMSAAHNIGWYNVLTEGAQGSGFRALWKPNEDEKQPGGIHQSNYVVYPLQEKSLWIHFHVWSV